MEKSQVEEQMQHFNITLEALLSYHLPNHCAMHAFIPPHTLDLHPKRDLHLLLRHARIMTSQLSPSTITASDLEALLGRSQTLPDSHTLLDARSSSLHALEHVIHSKPSPIHPLPCHTTAIVYDSGSVSLSHTFSLAARLITILRPTNPSVKFLLLIGGLPAVRTTAPHLIRHDPSKASISFPHLRAAWALRAIKALSAQHEPPAPILPWLYVGGVHHARPPPPSVTHLLVVAAELSPPDDDLTVLHIPALDVSSYDLLAHFQQIVDFLSTAHHHNHSVLVHCFAGSSRSVAAVAAYLIATGMSFRDALALITSRRRAAAPNEGFLRQLAQWEACVKARHLNMSPPIRYTSHLSNVSAPVRIPIVPRKDRLPLESSPTTPLLSFPQPDFGHRSDLRKRALDVTTLALPAPALPCVSDVSDGDQFEIDDALDDSLRSLHGRL